MLEKLEFMIALSREQHFGRAAESCGVAQPTLSLGIQSLEQMLNTPLVKRASRFQGFTPEGERVLVWAHRLVGDAKRDAAGPSWPEKRCGHCRAFADRRDPISDATGRQNHGSAASAPSERALYRARPHLERTSEHVAAARNRSRRHLSEQ